MATHPVPLDEFPVHQTPLSMAHVGTSDRNFYDRYYFNAHDRTGEVFLVSGLGVYPNLGVTDAYVAIRRGDRQHVVRCSDVLGDDRLHPTVGPYRIEVVEPLERLRLVCETADRSLSVDLTWTGSVPAVMEQHHLMHTGARPILDASRFAQVGVWEGTIVLDGEEITVEPDVWVGTRDRSWGIRPVGETEPPGRAADEALEGFWWVYCPIRFDDHALIVILQEDADGLRTLNDATRVWHDGRIEQLGWPEIEIDYRSGTRHPDTARFHLRSRTQGSFVVEVATHGFVALNVGAGYNGDPAWSHGQWRGRDWVEHQIYDMNAPEVRSMVPFGVVDHVASARYLDGSHTSGSGMFEHGTFGRHDPSGFTDWGSQAP